MKKVAIVGAGFAGLACAWHLSKKANSEITLFDPKGIGGGASGIAAGLLHPYAGFHCRKNWEADAGMEATLELLQVASTTLKQPVYEKMGILRPATTPDQKEIFKKAAMRYSDIQWLPSDDAIYIESGITVDCPLYLKGLYQSLSVSLEKKAIDSVDELKDFDLTIVTTGAKLLPEFQHLPVTPVKGQVLKFNYTPFVPINARAYLVKNTLGATFEHDFVDDKPCQKTAEEILLPKMLPIQPVLKEIPIEGCKAALRASTPDHRPIIEKLKPNVWCLTGLGSKGLLHHALMARKLVTLCLDTNSCPCP